METRRQKKDREAAEALRSLESGAPASAPAPAAEEEDERSTAAAAAASRRAGEVIPLAQVKIYSTYKSRYRSL